MTSTALRPPSRVPAIGDDDLARVERWAARQRAELSQLVLAVRSAQRRAEQSERAEQELPALGEAPEDVLSVLASLLDAAVRDADASIQAARIEAEATVATEREWAGDLLGEAGLDPLVVLGPAGWTSSTVADLDRPASAYELWHDADVAAHTEVVVPEPITALPAAWLEASPDEEIEPVAEEETDEADPLVVAFAAGPGRPTPQLVPAGEAASSGDAELFDVFWRGPEAGDVFWSEMEGTPRPLRDRLHRRVGHGGP